MLYYFSDKDIALSFIHRFSTGTMNRFYESAQLAENYAKYRPIYPSRLADRVVEYYRQHNANQGKIDVMLDVGCGSGQSANIFQSLCNKIVAYDVSPEQLKQAESQNIYDHVKFKVGQAEKINMDDKSVDLITAGMSAHYFDLPEFFQEVKRVLKPSGCLAIFGYYVPKIGLIGSNNANSTRQGTFLLRSFLGYAASESFGNLAVQVRLENGYDDIFKALPFTEKMRMDDIHAVTAASINDICGFIRSIDASETFLNRRIEEMKSINVPISKELIDVFDLATRFKSVIKKLWNLSDVNDDAKIVEVDHQFFALLATCP